MKKIIIIALLLSTLQSIAQQYNNEWINYSKTYYKFSVTTNGLHRITQNTLQNAGLGSTTADQFQLYRNGVQVPIYTTTNGIFGVADYIEFCGSPNDGTADTDMYNFATNHLNRKYSLINDTAAYFLTTNTVTTQNLRLANTLNNVAGNVLPIQQNFIHTTGIYEKTTINPGYAAVVGENLHASAYDKGEGWTSGDIGAGSPYSNTLTNLYADLSSPILSTYKIGASGNALYTRTIKVQLNGTTITNPSMDYFNDLSSTYNFNTSLFAANAANNIFTNTNTSSNGNDRMVMHVQEITYPRLFNFANQSYFEFQLAASAIGNYIEITNFNGGSNPILYDLTNGKRYIPVTGSGLLKFALTASTLKRNLVLVNTDNTSATNITSLQTKNFTNFIAPANQGNYIILTSKLLHNNTLASNVVEKYKAYRASVAGGSFTPIIVEAEDLYDQYAFGTKLHPNAIRNYLRQARTQFAAAPKFVLIIGRGMSYNESKTYEGQQYNDVLNHVPTFGYPASDNLLTAAPGTSIQTTPIGRIGAIYQSEVEAYLDKLKEYEAKQNDNNFTIANKLWMKNTICITGSSEPFLQAIIDGYHVDYMDLYKDTSTGAKTHLFTKTTAGGPVPLTNTFMESLWNIGLSSVEYFGHSSATTLEFNLDDPNSYSNQGKYPMMIINGCNAGNYYIYNPFRITTTNNQSLSEKFVLTPNRGSIGFIASTHFGVVNYLHYYNLSYTKAASTTNYGKSIGEIMKSSSLGMLSQTGFNDFYAKMHSEQILLQGDPAVKLNVAYPKPDYDIEDQTVKINPSFISIAESNFVANVKYVNLGKATKDSFNINVKRQYPSGLIETVFNKRVKAAAYADSTNFTFDIQPLRDKGTNKIIIKVDGDNEVSEMSEINNTITKEVFIFEDEARPVHPYNYAIVNQLPLRLTASTANPLAASRNYMMELDTTQLFNSPLKTSQTLSQVGGLLEFAPISTLIPNKAYYWRVAVQNSNVALPQMWNYSTFTYIPSSTFGFNQGHYYQHKNSTYQNIRLDSASRKFIFDSVGINISVRNGVWPLGAYEEGHATVAVNQDAYIRGICLENQIMFNVFDQISGAPWKNNPVGQPGQYNSDPTCYDGREWNFSFATATAASRKRAMDFIDLVPNGSYIIIRNTNLLPFWLGTPQDKYVAEWKTDQSLYGTGNSLYHKLYNLGCTKIDSFYTDRAYIFVVRKGMNSAYTPRQIVTEGIYDRISVATDFIVPDTIGFITSPTFGPAKAWQDVHWRGASIDAGIGDKPTVKVIGVKANGTEDSLLNLSVAQLDYNISSINASVYPYIKLKMRNEDGKYGTPWQLDYWRLNYIPVPEGAIAPNISLQVKDTFEVGDPIQTKLTFKNVSFAAFDSIRVKIIVLDQNNVPHIYDLPKQKPLAVGEMFTIDYTIPTVPYVGNNNIFIDVNPDNDQPEQFHFNNFLFKNFYVRPDNYNPLLDVTFDGVHILNKDIVASNPKIIIKLKDENKYLGLDDTTGLKIQIRYPGSSVLKTFNWNSDTLKFIPPSNVNSDNTATAELSPQLPVDGEYELIVRGKDKSGNATGAVEYKVLFNVINKPMISNLLNYPNPFTTSTAFVFTITGKEVPQNIKIEIMTITGKIVREITKNELGPLHIGRNITEYKWDATDQYGAKLANGVYLYRVVTNLNGNKLDKYKVGSEDKTEQYFNKGYGKMVIIR